MSLQRINNAYNNVKLSILFPTNHIKIISIFVLYNNIYLCMAWFHNSINFFLIDDNNIIQYPILKVLNDNTFIFNTKKINVNIDINSIFILYNFKSHSNKTYGIINNDDKKIFVSNNDKYLVYSITKMLKSIYD